MTLIVFRCTLQLFFSLSQGKVTIVTLLNIPVLGWPKTSQHLKMCIKCCSSTLCDNMLNIISPYLGACHRTEVWGSQPTISLPSTLSFTVPSFLKAGHKKKKQGWVS